MAGARQHILPRFFQKGFASRMDGDEVFAILYRHDQKPREVNTRNLAVEGKFYEAEDGTSVDDDITEAEVLFAPLLDRLRELPSGTLLSEPLVPALVAHMAIRTRHFRDTFKNATEVMIRCLDGYLADPANQVRLMLNNPKVMLDALDQQIEKADLPEEARAQVRALMLSELPKLLQRWVAEGNPEFQAMLQYLFTTLRLALPNVAKNGHVKALTTNVVPLPRKKIYEELTWFVARPETALVLGDSATLFRSVASGKIRPMHDDPEDIDWAYLPIASHCCLIGTSGGRFPDLDFVRIREASVSASRDYFLASLHDPELEALQARLGESAEFFTESEMEALALECIANPEK